MGAVAVAAKALLDRRSGEARDGEEEESPRDEQTRPAEETPPDADADGEEREEERSEEEMPTRDEAEREDREPEDEAREEREPAQATAAKSSGDASEHDEHDEPDERDERDDVAHRRASRTSVKIVTSAGTQLEQLTGRKPEPVLGVARSDGEWVVTFELVELSRVPSSTDVLAAYEVVVDGDGQLVRYERTRRYRRSESD